MTDRRSICLLVCAAAACDNPGAGPSCAGDGSTPVNAGVIVGIASTELSGLAASYTVADLLWAIDDAGAPNIYSLDTSATVHGTLRVSGVDPVDWEDIATGPCATGRCIYVADTGDNDLTRATVSLYQIGEPPGNPVGVLDVDANAFVVRLPGGPRDIEALVIDPRDGLSYGITKVTSGASEVYELPRVAGQAATATLVGTFEPPSGDERVTAADLAVDECAARLAIRTRNRLFELRGDPGATLAELLVAAPHEAPVADEEQGESVAYAADASAYFTVSEGRSPTLWRSDVH